MKRIEASIHIQAPPEVVFDFVSDLPRIPEYVDFVLEIFDISSQPTGVGTTYRERAKPGSLEQLQEWRCVEFKRPHVQVYEGNSSQMHVVLHKRMGPEPGGTRYSQWMEFEMFPGFRPLAWLLDPVVARQMAREFEKITSGIKAIIEREQAPAPTSERISQR